MGSGRPYLVQNTEKSVKTIVKEDCLARRETGGVKCCTTCHCGTGGRAINSADSLIMVVNRPGSAAENLKELIEFMDEPHVCTATPAKWQQQIGDSRLEAVFIGPDLSDRDIRTLVDDIGELDPNIPIVMITEDQDG